MMAQRKSSVGCCSARPYENVTGHGLRHVALRFIASDHEAVGLGLYADFAHSRVAGTAANAAYV
jgi:hypothetical protein